MKKGLDYSFTIHYCEKRQKYGVLVRGKDFAYHTLWHRVIKIESSYDCHKWIDNFNPNNYDLKQKGKVVRRCKQCNEIFTPNYSRVKRGEAFFCSSKCQGLARRKTKAP